MSCKFLIRFVGLTAIAVAASSLAAQAETSDTVAVSSATREATPAEMTETPPLVPTSDAALESHAVPGSSPISASARDLLTAAMQHHAGWESDKAIAKVGAPATALSAPMNTAPSSSPGLELSQQEVAQRIERGRGGVARYYIGAGGNIGFGDENTSLGQGSFAIISKFGIIPEVALRPSVLIGDDEATFLIPVTYNFLPPDDDVEGFRVAPYLGAGIGFTTDGDSDAGFLISGGFDVPIAPRVTGNAAINVGFFDNTDVGLIIGIGYNF